MIHVNKRQKRTQVTLRILKDTAIKLSIIANSNYRSLNGEIQFALDEYARRNTGAGDADTTRCGTDAGNAVAGS